MTLALGSNRFREMPVVLSQLIGLQELRLGRNVLASLMSSEHEQRFSTVDKVSIETFSEYLEFVLNQSLLDFAVERVLLTSKLGLLDRADPEDAIVPVGVPSLQRIFSAANELQTLSVRTLELDGHLTSTSVKKFFDEIVTVVIKGVILHDRAGTATYCEAHTSDHAMVDSPTYSVFYGLGEEQTGDVEGEK